MTDYSKESDYGDNSSSYGPQSPKVKMEENLESKVTPKWVEKLMMGVTGAMGITAIALGTYALYKPDLKFSAADYFYTSALIAEGAVLTGLSGIGYKKTNKK